MKQLLAVVVMVGMLFLGGTSFADNNSNSTFKTKFQGVTDNNWNIEGTTKWAINNGQSLSSILEEAKTLNLNIDDHWSKFVDGAKAAKMPGGDIWNELKNFVSPGIDISSVSRS